MLFSTLDRYIARHLALAVILTLLVLAGLGFIGLFMSNIKYVGHLDYGYGTLFQVVLLNLLLQVYETLPPAALIGVSAGLSMLALSSELIAMRAAGLSIYRICISVIKFCLVLVALAVALGEWLVPLGLEQADRIRAEALHQPVRDRIGNIWMRDDDQFVRIGEVLPDRSLKAIHIIDSRTPGVLVELQAEHAVYHAGQWELQGVRESRIEHDRVEAQHFDHKAWQPGFDPELMQTMQVPQKKMSTRDLLRYVSHLKDNGQNSDAYELGLWKKLVLPFSILIMVMLAVPFVFGSIRTGGLGKRVFIGVMIGFVFSLLQSGMGYYSLSFGVSPAAAALTPSIIFLVLTGVLFYRASRAS